MALLTEFPLILDFVKLSNIFCFITAGCRMGVGSIDVSGLLGCRVVSLLSHVLPLVSKNGLFRFVLLPLAELKGFDLPMVLNFPDVNGFPGEASCSLNTRTFS